MLARRMTVLLGISLLSAILIASGALVMAAEHEEAGKEMHRREGQKEGWQKRFSPELLHAAPLIGEEVVNKNDESLGEIDDLVLSAQRDRVSYVALSVGGVLGVGSKHVAVPWEALEIHRAGREKIDKVVLDARLKDLKAAEGFDTENWPQHGDQRWVSEERRRSQYRAGRKEKDWESGMEEDERGERRTAGMRRGEAKKEDEGREGDEPMGRRARREHEMASRGMQFRRLSEIIGLTVKNLEDEDIGDIENVVLDMHEGRPVYGVIGFGGFLGLGEKMAAIPWSAIDMVPRLETARVDASERVLKAIAFDQESSPDLAKRDVAEQLHSRFNEEPYWQTFGYAEPSQSEQRRSTKAWEPGSEYNKCFNRETIVTKKGTIESVGTFTPGQKATRGLRLRVKSEGGQMMTVHAGPRNFAGRQGHRFHYGDRVEVTGSLTEVPSGRRVIMATSIRKDGQTLQIRSSDGRPKWDAQ